MKKTYNFADKPEDNYTMTEQEIMDRIALVVINSFNSLKVFSLKGGWVLSKIFPNDFRKTIDVDMSIVDKKYFNNLIKNLELLCIQLINSGEIHNYKIIEPNVETRRSGGVKMFRIAPNGRRYKVSGLDVSIKPLDSCITILNNSIPVFCFERMMVDKLSVLFSDSYLRRMKDVFDTRLLIERCDLNHEKILKFIKENVVKFDLENSIFSEDFDVIKHEWDLFLNKSKPKSFQDLKENLDKIKEFLEELGVI